MASPFEVKYSFDEVLEFAFQVVVTNMTNLTDYRYFQTCKSRKENPQKPTQLSSRSHPRHLVGKRTAQKTPS